MKKSILLVVIVSFISCSQSVKVDISDETLKDLNRLPDDATAYFYCDFSKIADSRLTQDFFPFFNDRLQHEFMNEDFERFKEMTDFDPQEDFNTILLAVKRINNMDENPHIIIHGRFNEDKIINYLEDKAADEGEDIPWRKKQVVDHTVYLIAESDKNIGFCFWDNETLYFGESDWITSVLNQQVTGMTSKNRRQLLESIQFGEHVWFSVQPTVYEGEPLQDMINDVLPLTGSVSKLTMSAHMDQEIIFQGTVHCDSPETSTLMVDLMKGALAAAKLHVYKDRDAVDAINRINVKERENIVLIQGNLNKAFFDKLDKYSMLPWRKHSNFVF